MGNLSSISGSRRNREQSSSLISDAQRRTEQVRNPDPRRVRVQVEVEVQPHENDVMEMQDCKERSVRMWKWCDHRRYRMNDRSDACETHREHLHLIRPRRVKTQSMLTCFSQSEPLPAHPSDMRNLASRKQSAWELTREGGFRDLRVANPGSLCLR